MGLATILSAARSGLAAAEAGLKTGAVNVANAGAPGYTRQQVQLNSRVVAGNVVGVSVEETTRIADRWLERAVYTAAADAGRAETRASYLDRMQVVLGGPGNGAALPARVDALVAAATALGTAQGLAQGKADFVAAVEEALDGMRQLNSEANTLRRDISGELEANVARINELLNRIASENATVVSQKALGQNASGSIDRRNAVFQELGSLMSIRIRDMANGAVQVDTTSGFTLLDSRPRQLVYEPAGALAGDYPSISLSFSERDGRPGLPTGETLDSAAAGGTVGALLALRDQDLPQIQERLAALFDRMASGLNAASNDGTNLPPPRTLKGRDTGLVVNDSLRFTGLASIAVVTTDGQLVSRTDLNLGTMATVGDLVAAINAGLAGSGSASFANGALQITATGAGRGIAIGQDSVSPSYRSGQSLSAFFGLNDLIATPLVHPVGMAASDLHGFAAGQQAELVLRDRAGRELIRQTFGNPSGPTFGDLLADLNASPLATYGSFNVDGGGRLVFTPTAAMAGSMLSVVDDTMRRFDTGLRLTTILGLDRAEALAAAQIRSDLAANPALLPLARLQQGAPGTNVVGVGDTRGAAALEDALMSGPGQESLAEATGAFVAQVAADVRRASNLRDERNALYQDAIGRRDDVSSVNIDEELAQMVVLQNSYAAAARMVTTADQMYQTLLGMLR